MISVQFRNGKFRIIHTIAMSMRQCAIADFLKFNDRYQPSYANLQTSSSSDSKAPVCAGMKNLQRVK